MAALLWLVDRGTVTVRLEVVRPDGNPQPSLGTKASFKNDTLALSVTEPTAAAALAALRLLVMAAPE